MREIEITVFVYSEKPFKAHISEGGVENGITPENVYDIYLGKEKPPSGVVVKFKLPDGSKKYVRGE